MTVATHSSSVAHDLGALWDASERRSPDKTAVVAGSVRLTYRALGERVRALAGVLRTRWGVGKGDTVALLAPNGPEFVVAYFAILRLGAVVQPLDERLTADELQGIVLDAGTCVGAVHPRLRGRLDAVRTSLPRLDRVVELGPDIESAGDTVTLEGPGVGPQAIAELMYTSGTVGPPKGVLRSHGNVRAASRNAIRGFGYRGDDVIAIVMPLSHSSALSSQLVPLIELGGTVVLVDRFDPEAFLGVVTAEGVTCWRAVPAMFRQLLALPSFRADALPSCRLLVNSSATIDAGMYAEVKRRFARVSVLNSYGLTEASTCTVLADDRAQSRADSIGAPIPGVEMCVIDELGQPVGPDVEGELCVRGPHVFLGYHNRPAETAAALRDGWLRTGDLGRRDADGLYYVHGRRAETINCGGRKFSPLEVERCIAEVPGIADVAVVAQAHRVLGEVARALVVPVSPGTVTAKTITGHCARRLASHKVPFAIEFVSELPRNAVGKTVRRRVTAEA